MAHASQNVAFGGYCYWGTTYCGCYNTSIDDELAFSEIDTLKPVSKSAIVG